MLLYNSDNINSFEPLTLKKDRLYLVNYLILEIDFCKKYILVDRKIKMNNPTKVVNNGAIIRIKIKHNKSFILYYSTFSDEKDILKLFIELKKQVENR